MKKRLTLATMLLLAASQVHAENREKTSSLTPYIGGYTFDGTQHLKTALTAGLRMGYNVTRNLAAELSGGVTPTAITRTDKSLNAVIYRLDALYNFMPQNKLVPFLVAGVGGAYINSGLEQRNKPLANYGVGAKYFVTDDIALRGDVRHVLPLEHLRHNVEYTLGTSFFFDDRKPAPSPVPAPAPVAAPTPKPVPAPVADSDGDGIPDAADACPGTPKGAQVDATGCPLDSDKDSVFDYLDKCPGTQKGIQVNADGCPLDADSDGVPDYLDNCPGTPKGIQVDANGCPLDSDKDNVPDYLDKCPGTSEGVRVYITGCPADSDKDGVSDHLDRCPGTPAGTIVDKNGCPPAAPKAAPVEQRESISLEIEFPTGKATILPKYHDEIGKVAEFMKKYPSVKGEIEGHTDNIGSKESNVKLSQRRADGVRTYLIQKYKIEPSRLTATGYGPTRPIAGNDTAAGRQKNRRTQATFDTVITK